MISYLIPIIENKVSHKHLLQLELLFLLCFFYHTAHCFNSSRLGFWFKTSAPAISAPALRYGFNFSAVFPILLPPEVAKVQFSFRKGHTALQTY